MLKAVECPRWCLAVLVALTCLACTRVGESGYQGPKGDTGPQGPAGPIGPTGASGSAQKTLVWVDAAGVALSWTPNWVDAQGMLWEINVETGKLPDADRTDVLRFFAAGGCTGQAFLVPPRPRTPFKVPGDSAWRVRSDTQQVVSMVATSYIEANGACSPTGYTFAMNFIPLDAHTIPSSPIADPPTFTPPLHQELR